jgi:GNAT superfamily N-acetyltransferase
MRSQEATGLPDPRFISPDELGNHLYARHALERCVAIEMGRIVGHALVELPNPEHLDIWRSGLDTTQSEVMLELGGAFVAPSLARSGIWSALLRHRLELVRTQYASTPVTATWSQNEHVKRKFIQLGGKEVGEKITDGGTVSLFVF